MKALIKVEMKKMNLKSQVRSFVIANLIMFFATLMLVTMNFGDGLLGQPVYLIDLVVKGTFTVWQAVLISELIVDEIINKTMMQLYTYPIKRTSIMKSKMFLIAVITLSFHIISQLILNVLFMSLDTIIPFYSYSISLQNVIVMLLTSILAVMIGMIPLVVGIWTKSSSSTVVTAIVISSIFGGVGLEIISNLTIMLAGGILGIIFVLANIKDFHKNDLIN